MRKEVVEIVLEQLKEALGGVYKAFYDGDPDVIPAFNMPAIVVQKQSDTNQIYSSSQDDVTETILIKVILDKSDDWTATDDKQDLTEAKIRRMVEARDGTSGRWLDNTVKHVLRETLEGNGLDLVGPTEFELGTLPRANDVVTMEGHVRFTVRYSVDIR